MVFAALSRITYLTDKKWHSTSTVYKQFQKILKDAKPLSYRRVFDILNELENAGLVVSKTGSKGRYGYSTEYMLTVPPDTVELLNQKFWEKLVDMKEKRYEMLHNPKYGSGTIRAKYDKFGAEKFWRHYVGAN